MVYQNHRLENVDSMEKEDGHQYPPRSVLPPQEAMFPITSISLERWGKVCSI